MKIKTFMTTKNEGQAWWLTPVILATRKIEISRIEV
jgi:hypothetical protein